jgi:hypothetical protein
MEEPTIDGALPYPGSLLLPPPLPRSEGQAFTDPCV